MFTITVEKKENIERAIKRFKTKCDSTRLIKQMRAKRHFCKPSVRRRTAKLKAIYRQRFLQQQAAG